jgi:predicted nucleic acid-binding protein
VDTDVVSFDLKKDTRAVLYDPHLQGWHLTVSFMTVAELRRWARQRNWGRRRTLEMEERLRQFTVYQSNDDLCSWWSIVTIGARRRGRPIEVADAWIAATAMLYGIPLVTHNPDDFVGVDGLVVVTERAGRP